MRMPAYLKDLEFDDVRNIDYKERVILFHIGTDKTIVIPYVQIGWVEIW